MPTTTTRLLPSTEYVIHDVYLPTGPTRVRGDLVFRTDADRNVWVKGAGRREDASLNRWFSTHPRLEVVRSL